MPEDILLTAQKRTIVGKQVKQLRRDFIVPAVLYGVGIDPVNIQIDRRILDDALSQAGGTTIITLHVGDEEYNALVRDVQRHTLRQEIMHVDFRRIRMDETIQVDVPIVTVGEPDMEDAVAQIIAESEDEIIGNAVMIPGINTITVEALPRELPSEFTVDLSVLTDFDTVITVADLEVPEGVTLIADPDEMIARMQFVIEVDEEEEEEEEALFGETAEVEVIGRGAEEEEEFFDEEEEEI